MHYLKMFFLLLGTCLCLPSLVQAVPRVSRVVYVMLENHAFDNMLGWLPGLSNPLSPTASCDVFDGSKYCATSNGAYVDPDPDHSVPSTAQQIFGTSTPPDEHDPSAVTMGGFVASYADATNASFAKQIMDCFDPSHVPIISTLATQFTVLEDYHASVPGPTFPNRLFAMSASSYGFGDNDDLQTVLGWPQVRPAVWWFLVFGFDFGAPPPSSRPLPPQ